MSEKFLDLLIVLWLIVVPFAALQWYFARRSKKLRASLDQSEKPQGQTPVEQDAPRLAVDRAKKPLALAILAAFVAVIGAFALEIVAVIIVSEIYGSRLMPRGPGWIVLPALAGIWAWRHIRADAHKKAASVIRNRTTSLNREGRFKLVLSLLWAGLLCIFWLVAKPYRYAYGSEHALLFMLWLILPPLAALGTLKALRWASQGSP